VQDIPRIAQSVFSKFFIFFNGTLSVLVNVLLVSVVTIMLIANSWVGELESFARKDIINTWVKANPKGIRTTAGQS